MADNKPRILLVNTYDIAGGAEKVAMDLLYGYQARGHQSSLVVGRKFGNNPSVSSIQNNDPSSNWEKFWRSVQYILAVNHHTRISKFAANLSQLKKNIETKMGIENFNFPGSYSLLEQPYRPNIIHAHNLHRDYFDLRALPNLSRKVPFIITLHDAWLLSGHCAHSFGCERWRIGCGNCPDLSIYPSIQRDATKYNWQRKRRIFAKSRLYIAAASHWLMDKVKDSILAASIKETRLIPYGVDLSLFRPDNKMEARASAGLPQNKFIILLRAKSIRKDRWKDFELMNSVIEVLSASKAASSLLFLALGQNAQTKYVGHTEIRFVPYQEDLSTMVKYLQAADMYIHPARADTFPLVVLEALACGLPVVATAVGGLPEQIKEGVTGFLVTSGDVEAMTATINHLVADPMLQKQMSQNAVEDAQHRFDQNRHVNDYLTWFQEILENTT